MFGSFFRRAVLFELGYIGAGRKRLVPGATQHDDPDLVIVGEILCNAFDALPHFKRNGISFVGLIQD